MARATGKLILFGEHAVVHGQPAIAVPLQAVSIEVVAQAAPTGAGLSIHVPATGITARLDTDKAEPALAQPAWLALQYMTVSEPPDLALQVTSTIPIASGFGSGAALSKAIIQAILEHAAFPYTLADLNQLVYETEKLHHGTPSGIDNTVIVYEQPVYFVRGTPIQSFEIAEAFELVVAHVGHATPTHVTVGAVNALYATEAVRIGKVFDEIGEIVDTARDAIKQGHVKVLGPLMNRNHELLRTLTVSDDTLDAYCETARRHGALGAKLSGGGRGGNMLALVTTATRARVTEALQNQGAQHIIHTTVI